MAPMNAMNGHGRWLLWVAGVFATAVLMWAGWQHRWDADQDVCLSDHGSRLTGLERRVDDNLLWIRDALERIENSQRRGTP